MTGISYPRARLLVAALLVFSISVLSGFGCGGSKKGATITGKVTIDGTAANSGSVIFKNGTSVTYGTIRADGNYTASGVPVGEAEVTVEGITAPKMGNVDPKMAVSTKDGPAGTVENPIPIPPKYAKPESSGLKFLVKSGNNSKNWELTTK